MRGLINIGTCACHVDFAANTVQTSLGLQRITVLVAFSPYGEAGFSIGSSVFQRFWFQHE